MSGLLSILPVIIIAIIGSLISSASKRAQQAREEAVRQQQGARRVTSMDEQLRQEIHQRVDSWQQPTTAQSSTLESQNSYEGSDARWPIAPSVSPEQPKVRESYSPSSPRVAVNENLGGPDDRSVTRRVTQRAYAAEDSHSRGRAPHMQDDERAYDSFTGAATFRRSAPRVRGERVDIRPLLKTPMAMANAVILTEVLHHRGGRSAKWNR